MTVLFVAALLLIVAAMGCLALGMERHFVQVRRRQPLARQLGRWRMAGAALLVLSLTPCLAGWGASIGVVLWLGLLAAGVLSVAGYLALVHEAPGPD